MDVEPEYLSAMLLDHITRQIIPSSSSITTVGEWYKFMCSRMLHSEWQLDIIPFISMMHQPVGSGGCIVPPLLRGLSVMEDEGGYGDHMSGVSATDGAWHHVVSMPCANMPKSSQIARWRYSANLIANYSTNRLLSLSPQAITWDSHTGRAVLYDNGRPVWRVYRSKGKAIPSGGTLVIGREQVRVWVLHGWWLGSRPDRITS